MMKAKVVALLQDKAELVMAEVIRYGRVLPIVMMSGGVLLLLAGLPSFLSGLRAHNEIEDGAAWTRGTLGIIFVLGGIGLLVAGGCLLVKAAVAPNLYVLEWTATR